MNNKNYEVIMTSDFIIEYIGEEEVELYDMEVQDNHNYFVNDILLGNSSYMMIELPFNKFNDVHKTVDYTQKVAKAINALYLDIMNTEVAKWANLDPDYNLMNFKSEVVAFRGFFRSKKYYALAKIWDEGNFMSKPKMKKTGGQIVKADTTKISYEFLGNIYKIFVTDFSIKDKILLYKKVFVNLKNEYINKIKNYINNFQISEFGIPKKWGLKDFKVIPKQVLGAMLYNTIFEDVIRPGDSIMVVQIKVKNFKPLINYITELNKKNKSSEYQLNISQVNSKLNVISVPTGIENDKEKVQKIHKRFSEFGIELDLDTISNFNIDMKLAQFEVLFEDEIKRQVLGAGGSK